jgi:DNA modification methylase
MAEMDEALLREVFSVINEADISADLTGFSSDDLSDIFKDVKLDEIDFEEADENIPEVPEAPFTQEGDIWQLGGHRLVCGDSTKPSTYESLMQGELARLIVTDPPYNVDYEGGAGKIMNDSMDSTSFRAFLRDMYNAAASVTANGAGIYVFHADGEGVAFREELKKAGFLLKQCLVWVKNSFVLGRQDYQWRHELILYGWKDGAAHYFTEQRNLSTVLDESGRPDISRLSREEMAELLECIYDEVESIDTTVLYCDKPLKNTEHPTMKPTTLIAKLIENSSKSGWAVLDPFGGSGSTLIACEGTGRTARLIELDPKFCDVIVKRYIRTTGKRDVTLIRKGVEVDIKQIDIL